jgi:hypothetical protein
MADLPTTENIPKTINEKISSRLTLDHENAGRGFNVEVAGPLKIAVNARTELRFPD